AFQGDAAGARAAGEAALCVAAELGGFYPGLGYGALSLANLADANLDACSRAGETAAGLLSVQPVATGIYLFPLVEMALGRGDLATARRLAGEGVSTTKGWNLATALRTRARVALAQHDFEQAEREAHAALTCANDVQAYLCIADTFECLARVAIEAGSHHEAARMLGAAEAARQRHGEVRFKVYDADYENAVVSLRDTLVQQDFES